MIASLPMYDTGATRAANDRLWREIREHYGRGPRELVRTGDPHEHWQNPDMVLSQTCGLPYRKTLHGTVHLVGTPNYQLPGCPPGYYQSYIVSRRDDPRRDIADFCGAVFARNDSRSQSGWAAITEELSADCLSRVIDTGSHVASVQLVAVGEADFAAIDAVTWSLLARETRETETLHVMATTRPTPGLPYIAGLQEDPVRLYQAIKYAISALSVEDRKTLMLHDLVAIPAEDYLALR